MIDGRLLVPAAAAWLGAVVTAVGLGLVEALDARHSCAVLTCRLAAAVAVGLALSCLVPWPARARIRQSLPVVVGMGSLLLGVVAAGAHSAALTSAPVATWVQARATATVRGVIAGEPVTRTSTKAALWQAATRVEVRMSTSSISARGESVEAALPLVLRMAADAAVPPPGTTVEVTGRLGPVPWQVEAAGALNVASRGEALQAVSGPGWVDSWAHAMRTGLQAALVGTPPDAGALVAGLAVGDESLQPDELADAMRSTGLSHLTAVSGGNVAIILVLVLGLATLAGMSLPIRVGVALLALAFFVVLVGPQPSVLRAAVMGSVVLVGLLTGGRRAGPSVLAASVLLLIVLAPGLAASWGFALSVFATAGLILLVTRVEGWYATWRLTRRWPPAVRAALAITTAAQLATLPLLVAMGAGVGWVALPANLLAMPAVAPVTVLGLVAAAMAPFAPVPAGWIATVAAWPAGWIAHVALIGSGLPLSRFPWPEGWWGFVLLAVAVGAIWLVRRGARRRYPGGVPRRLTAAGLTMVAVVAGLWLVAPLDRRGWPPPGWFFIMCDVGQGDALLVRTGESAAVLVDAGPDPDLVDRCLDDAQVQSVDAVVLTHYHADHVNGLLGVFRGREVGAVLVTPIRNPLTQAHDVDTWLAGMGRTATPITAGDARRVGGIEWLALWPRRVIVGGSIPNNASIVLVVTVAGHHLLLTGDIESEVQAAIASDLRALKVDVMKVPHHASSVQNPRLTEWAPAPVALVSVGLDNPYGHPAPDTLAAWEELGALVARTDQVGDIAVVTVGPGIGVVDRHGMLPSS